MVEPGGDGVVAHVGLHALGRFGDRLGLGDCLSEAVGWSGERLPVHDRGKVLVQAMLMFAGGGEACTDIETLRAQAGLFGSVPSDSTLWRTFNDDLDTPTRERLWAAMGKIRAGVWERSSVTGAGEVVLDIDASLHEIHSENKEGTAPNYKRGFGFHPLYCTADATGETLAVKLRPGNATANNIADHVEVLDQAIASLPEAIAVGHRKDDPGETAVRRVRVRADSAGCTTFVHRCRARNIAFSVVARRNVNVHAAISRVAYDDDAWTPALTQDGRPRKGAAVADVTAHADMSTWPEGTRLIVRREPL
ncbi:MAG: IS1380 family transposase, partial [Actinomycetia bacterium]|nr:IS1380 family transposase [Actinomycetes bacterium]